VLRIGREKISDKGVQSANKRVDPLKSHTGLTREAIMEHLVSSFTSSYGLRPGGVTAEEMERANTLAVEKFATQEWFHRVP